MEIAAPVRLRERCPVCGSMKLPRGMHRQDGLGEKVVGSLDRLHAMKKQNRKSLVVGSTLGSRCLVTTCPSFSYSLKPKSRLIKSAGADASRAAPPRSLIWLCALVVRVTRAALTRGNRL